MNFLARTKNYTLFVISVDQDPDIFMLGYDGSIIPFPGVFHLKMNLIGRNKDDLPTPLYGSFPSLCCQIIKKTCGRLSAGFPFNEFIHAEYIVREMKKIIHSFRIFCIELVAKIIKASDRTFNQTLVGFTGLSGIKYPDIILHTSLLNWIPAMEFIPDSGFIVIILRNRIRKFHSKTGNTPFSFQRISKHHGVEESGLSACGVHSQSLYYPPLLSIHE